MKERARQRRIDGGKLVRKKRRPDLSIKSDVKRRNSL